MSASADVQVDGGDEEFVFHLGRGAELLAKGELEAAKVSLERAFELRPRDVKVLGLLGQVCYKLGRFEQAIEIYTKLVDDNPVEASARVNLGLASLKAKRHADAIRQLQIALDLNPDHKKALGYLGLAWYELKDWAKARDCFAKAGSDQMVARCEQLIAEDRQAADEGRLMPRPPPPEPSFVSPPPPRATPLPEPVPAADEIPQSPALLSTLADYSQGRLLATGSAALGPFVSDGRTLAVNVKTEMLARAAGMFAVQGNLALLPEMKRFRGRPTDKTFGDGEGRMLRASGAGTLYYSLPGRALTVLDLGSEAAYFREEVVFAFEETITFENGRVPARTPPDLNLVHLRGRGGFLLVTLGEPVAVAVTAGTPLRVPIVALVGWHGALTPKVEALVRAPGEGEGEPDGGLQVVELSGEGRVLIDPGAPGPSERR